MTENRQGGAPTPTLDDPGFAAALASLPDATVLLDGSGRLRWANPAAERLFGWHLDDWLEASGLDLVHPEDVELAALALVSVQGKEVGTPLELRVRTAGGWKLVELIGAPLEGDPDGAVILSLRDLTERRRWEVASDEVARFRSLVHNAASVTMLVSPLGSIEAVSGALTRLLGHDPEVVVGQPLAAVVDPDDRPLLVRTLARAAAEPPRIDTSPVTVEVRVRRHGPGEPVPFELTIVNLLDDPTVGGFVVSGHDISRLRAAQDALETLASRDALTGLPNRSALDRRLAEAVAARRAGRSVAVAFVDLDRFKPINDLLGHDVGDELLRHLAARLRSAVREEDLVARFGGDEFVVVAYAEPDEAAALADRLEEAVARPFRLGGGPAQVFASVGLVMAEPDHTPETLLAEADARMYSVKRQRRGSPLEPILAVGERRQLAEELATALSDDQLTVHYQPIVRLADRSLVGYEALVRWQHPTRGLLGPAAFMGVAEDAGREAEVGERVLRMACARLATLGPVGDRWPTMAVNLSAGQMAGDGFVHLVDTVLNETGVAPGRLCLELTERSILERPAHGPATPVLLTLEGLASLGVRLAIDDFGTGYSSLTHVLQFPVHVLKIDRSFVAGVGDDHQHHSVVAAVIELARGMGIDAVAEGIEQPDQLEALRRLGCPYGQGYLLGRPAPDPAPA